MTDTIDLDPQRPTLTPVDIDPDDLYPDDEPPALTGWHITDDEQAQRAVRRRNKAIAEEDRLRLAADLEIAAIKAWLDRALAPVVDRRERAEAALGDYLHRLRQEDPSRKSLRLPGGTIKYLQGRPSIVVDDPDAAAVWLVSNGYPDAVKHTVTVDRNELKRTFAITGEGTLTEPIGNAGDVPGVHAEWSADKYTVSAT